MASQGPAGQTDRLAALILFSLLSPYFNWMHIFLIWCTIGGAATVILRLINQSPKQVTICAARQKPIEAERTKEEPHGKTMGDDGGSIG